MPKTIIVIIALVLGACAADDEHINPATDDAATDDDASDDAAPQLVADAAPDAGVPDATNDAPDAAPVEEDAAPEACTFEGRYGVTYGASTWQWCGVEMHPLLFQIGPSGYIATDRPLVEGQADPLTCGVDAYHVILAADGCVALVHTTIGDDTAGVAVGYASLELHCPLGGGDYTSCFADGEVTATVQ